MKATKNETYTFDGKTFSGIRDVAQYIENAIGKIIDTTPIPLGPKTRIAIYDTLVANRDRICALLLATFEQEVIHDSITEDTNIVTYIYPRRERS